MTIQNDALEGKPTAALDRRSNFYTSVLPQTGLRVLAVFKNGLKSAPTHTFYDGDDDLIEAAETYNKLGKNVYHACATYTTDANRKGENVEAVKAIWLDLDVGEKKPYPTQREAVVHFEDFRNALGLPKSHIVSSGGGVHIYLPFTKAIPPSKWDRIAALFAQCLDHYGVKHDTSRTQDKASILRIPGTSNYKTNPAKAVTLKRLGEDTPVADLWRTLKDYADANGLIVGEAKTKGKPAESNDMIGVQVYPPSVGELVADKCEVLREVADTGGDVSYEIWWRAMGVAKHTTEPTAVAINWTRNRAATDHDQTDYQKGMDEWNTGPTTCVEFSKHSTKCDDCEFKGKVKSPITLGTPEQHIGEMPIDLNEKYAWIEANASIYRLEYLDFIDPAKFKTQHDNQTVAIQCGRSSRQVGIGTLWLKDSRRRQHKKLVLRPGEKLVTLDNCLNEWQGFPVTATPGNIKPYLWLQRRLVPNRAARRYMLMWLSHLVQHPDIKMHVSLAIWSIQQGVGKNLLFECITSIIGAAHSTVIGQAELASIYNGWANRKVLVIGDEVSNSDRRQDTDKLKGLVTGTTIYINDKYQPARAAPNFLNFIFLSNHNDALFVSDQDRRYFVWEVAADRLSEAKAKWFADWRDGGGLAALLHFLQHFDLTGFNPKAPAPMTDAKRQMVQDNRSDLENWVAELMDSNVATLIGRELATGNELAHRYAIETGRQAPSAKTIVSASKKHGAAARTNQVRMPNGKKYRVLALTRSSHWIAQPEPDWATEMAKPFKLK
jgi:hypothetical protein